ncbi:MAG: hypothetical protein BA863_06195 [Desulfovibrio sp. S3730MH75]|nr:MAG: hypothetical protein BA863_06195 [Desulfovibrio sp. S3730MH75]
MARLFMRNFFSMRNIFVFLSINLFLVSQLSTAFGDDSVKLLTLEDAIRITVLHNEDIAVGQNRVDVYDADALSAEAPYDTSLFYNGGYSRWNDLSEKDYASPANPAKDYVTHEAGVRQHFYTGSEVTLSYSDKQTENLGLVGSPSSYSRDYASILVTQHLLEGIADAEQQGNLEKAKLKIDESKEGLRQTAMGVINNLIQQYWFFVQSRLYVDIAQDTLNLAEEVLRRERQREKSGLVKMVDVYRAEAAVEERRYTLLEFKRNSEVAQDRLKMVMNSPVFNANWSVQVRPSTSLGEIVIPIADQNKAVAEAFKSRPELRQLDILMQQLGIDIDINDNKLLPDLDLSFEYRTETAVNALRSAEDFQDTPEQGSLGVGLFFSIPIQNSEAEGAVKRSTALLRIAKKQNDKARNGITVEIRRAIHNLDLARRGISVTRRAVKKSEETAMAERRLFELKQISNRDLLTAQDELGRNKMNYVRSMVDGKIAVASYDYARGILLDTYKVTAKDLEPKAVKNAEVAEN